MDFTTTILPPLGRIEAKLDLLLKGPQSPTLTIREAMKLTGDNSLRAFYRTCSLLGIVRVKRNCYRRTDIMNGLGRRALQNAAETKRRHEAALAAESVTEGRRHKIFPKQKPE